METIGERLKIFAKKANESVSALAEKLGISQGSLSSYITGRNEPGIKLLARLIDVGCSIDWLLTGQGNMMRANDGLTNHSNFNIEQKFKLISEYATMINEIAADAGSKRLQHQIEPVTKSEARRGIEAAGLMFIDLDNPTEIYEKLSPEMRIRLAEAGQIHLRPENQRRQKTTKE